MEEYREQTDKVVAKINEGLRLSFGGKYTLEIVNNGIEIGDERVAIFPTYPLPLEVVQAAQVWVAKNKGPWDVLGAYIGHLGRETAMNGNISRIKQSDSVKTTPIDGIIFEEDEILKRINKCSSCYYFRHSEDVVDGYEYEGPFGKPIMKTNPPYCSLGHKIYKPCDFFKQEPTPFDGMIAKADEILNEIKKEV